jgi:signal transduction histidine kinase
LQRSGNLAGHSLDLPDIRLDLQSPSFLSLQDHRLGRLRAVCIPLLRGSQPRILLLAISDRDTEAALAGFRRMMFLLLPASLVVTALVSVIYVGRALQPVTELRCHAAEMTARLEPSRAAIWEPIPVSNPNDELGRLAETFNQLFRRIDSVMRQLRQFVTDAAHELRTPLTVLQGETELLLSRPRSTAEYHAAVTVIDGELDKLSRIVKGLFTLSLADAGQLHLAHDPLYLNEVLEESCALAEPLARSKRITIDRQLSGAVPCTGDEIFLRQLFVIFLDNAIKYSATGTIVEVSLDAGSGQAEVRFRDSGAGIAPAHLPHIFERFYRAAPAGPGQGESGGLGLPIAQAIIRACGGSIDCRSVVGSGSTFTVRLPLTN